MVCNPIVWYVLTFRDAFYEKNRQIFRWTVYSAKYIWNPFSPTTNRLLLLLSFYLFLYQWPHTLRRNSGLRQSGKDSKPELNVKPLETSIDYYFELKILQMLSHHYIFIEYYLYYCILKADNDIVAQRQDVVQSSRRSSIWTLGIDCCRRNQIGDSYTKRRQKRQFAIQLCDE